MAHKVIWSHEATADLEALADCISRDSAFYAAAFVQEILDASRSLNEFSGRGRIVPELSIKEYRLIYSIEEPRVVILGLIHGKRDLKTLWERERR